MGTFAKRTQISLSRQYGKNPQRDRDNPFLFIIWVSFQYFCKLFSKNSLCVRSLLFYNIFNVWVSISKLNKIVYYLMYTAKRQWKNLGGGLVFISLTRLDFISLTDAKWKSKCIQIYKSRYSLRSKELSVLVQLNEVKFLLFLLLEIPRGNTRCQLKHRHRRLSDHPLPTPLFLFRGYSCLLSAITYV